MDIDDAGDGEVGETVNIMDLSLGRAPEPASTDGDVCSSIAGYMRERERAISAY